MRTKKLIFEEIKTCVYHRDESVDEVNHHKEGFNNEALQML